jgi:hypothetical protein
VTFDPRLDAHLLAHLRSLPRGGRARLLRDLLRGAVQVEEGMADDQLSELVRGLVVEGL